MRFAILLLGSLLLTLSGCSHFGTQEQLSGSGEASSWQSHKQQITPVDAWQINGKIGIRSEKESRYYSGCNAKTTLISAYPAHSVKVQHA